MLDYTGRFAPTPSGPLHRGSLVTALGSYLAARAAGGRWLLRIDDLDHARVDPTAEARILSQLEAHSLQWDGAPRRQSEHVDSYREGLRHLLDQNLIYACRCTRAELAMRSLPGADEMVYAATCRDLALPMDRSALRLRVPDQTLTLIVAGVGSMERKLSSDIGDFIVRRRDGQIAYQLACAIDEAAQGITEVVRGSDLIGSSFRQVHLMRCLHLPAPNYRHLPLVLDRDGRKLSKQNHAEALSSNDASANLAWALKFLGQSLPAQLEHELPAVILDHAWRHWRPPNLAAAPQQIT